MKNIIGLGGAGIALVNAFEQYQYYKTYKIDASSHGAQRVGTRHYNIRRQDNPELYEQNIPDLKTFFRGLRGEVLFIIGGSGNISNASLVIMEQIKHCNIHLMYIKPDTSFLGEKARLQERVVYNVLQEMTRSGVFKNMYLIHNPSVESVLGGAPVIGYYEKINEVIASTFHMLNVYKDIKPVQTTRSGLPVATRISTLGLVDPETNKETLFFPLDNVSDMTYYYAYNETKLRESKDILTNIKNNIKQDDGEIRASYSIYATNYEEDYAYCEAHTSVIQSDF